VDLQLAHSVWIGLAATAVMTLLLYLLPLVGFPKTDIAYILGSMLRAPTHRAAYYGLGLHFAMGVIFAFLYGFAYLTLDVSPSWWIGILSGIVHWLSVMLAMNPFAELHVEMRERRMRRPGLFMTNLGAEFAVASAVRHISFGALVGFLFDVYG